MTLSKKHKKINGYHLKNDKVVLKTRITKRRRAVIIKQSSTVDLRNRFITVMIQKIW